MRTVKKACGVHVMSIRKPQLGNLCCLVHTYTYRNTTHQTPQALEADAPNILETLGQAFSSKHPFGRLDAPRNITPLPRRNARRRRSAARGVAVSQNRGAFCAQTAMPRPSKGVFTWPKCNAVGAITTSTCAVCRWSERSEQSQRCERCVALGRLARNEDKPASGLDGAQYVTWGSGRPEKAPDRNPLCEFGQRHPKAQMSTCMTLLIWSRRQILSP